MQLKFLVASLAEPGRTRKKRMESLSVRYSVVVALFNDATNIATIHHDISAVMEKTGSPYEIIFVDDGSSDNTGEVLTRIHDQDPKHVKAVQLMRNFGQHPAVTAGFKHADGEIIITIDSDLQNPPDEIPKLLERLDEGYDVVTGWRQMRGDSWTRTLPSRLINWIISSLTGVKLHDYGCMLRVYRRHVIELLNQCSENRRFITALTSWLGVKIAEVPVRHISTPLRDSHYNYRRLIRMTIDLITGYSLKPIQVLTIMGLGLAFLGIASGLFLLGWRICFQVNPSGLSSFIALLLVLFGVQLAGLGIIGEYIGRIYMELQGRPYYIVRSTLDRTLPDEE